MKEEDVVKAQAEVAIEPLFRIIKQTLIDTYMKGFIRGMELKEDEDEAMQRLKNEAEAVTVRLKPDAILKRRLKEDEFPTRVWHTLESLGIYTLGDMLRVSEISYLRHPNFGMGSLNFIKKFVQSYGYKLKEK